MLDFKSDNISNMKIYNIFHTQNDNIKNFKNDITYTI
jgi:hypothetical protein